MTPALQAQQVMDALHELGDAHKAEGVARFFKCAPGQYGEGDRFVGVSVPVQRSVARRFAALPLDECVTLLHSPWHEHRLTALFIMVRQHQRGEPKLQKQIFTAYLGNLAHVNNWDLVDSSAHQIVGPMVVHHPRPLLQKLLRSKNLWERRVAVLTTYHFIVNGDAAPTLWVAPQLLGDAQDLIHKAVGWMLREVGKRVDEKLLVAFLEEHAAAMPRTMLRYALERLPAAKKARFMRVRKAV